MLPKINVFKQYYVCKQELVNFSVRSTSICDMAYSYVQQQPIYRSVRHFYARED